MKWNRVQSAASWTKNTTIFTQNLSNIAGEQNVEACCSQALSDQGTLPNNIAEKLGMIIRDLIDFNNIQIS